jgi:DnaJ-class molecular chaperone
MPEDYYAVLGLEKGASPADIKKAFRQIAKECHPDTAGEDPVKLERFKAAKDAYEVLSDPASREKYDQRLERRGQRVSTGGSFRDAFYRRTAENYDPDQMARQQKANDRSKRRVQDPANNLDLDDLFNGFGFGGAKPGAGARPGSSTPPPPRGQAGARDWGSRDGHPGASSTRARPPMPQPGRDVHLDVDVPWNTAIAGGVVTVVYHRMQRSEQWRPGSTDPGVIRVQDLADVRLIPGTRDGEILHERGKGDAGAHGGPYGDLIVRVRVGPAPSESPGSEPRSSRGGSDPSPAEGPRTEPPRTETPPPSAAGTEAVPRLAGTEPGPDGGIAEAILGARIALDTPQGRVRIAVPPGTSSGARLRLREKGETGADGRAADWFVRLRIVVPREVDAESRALIEAFAARNPME